MMYENHSVNSPNSKKKKKKKNETSFIEFSRKISKSIKKIPTVRRGEWGGVKILDSSHGVPFLNTGDASRISCKNIMSHDTGVLNLIRNGRLGNAAWKRIAWTKGEKEREKENEREKKKMKMVARLLF